MFRKLLGLAGVSSLLVVAPLAAAGAANLPVKAVPPAPAPAPIATATWSGCYIDGGIGYGLWDEDHFTEITTGLTQILASTNSAGRGWLGRLGGGCDYQAAR